MVVIQAQDDDCWDCRIAEDRQIWESLEGSAITVDAAGMGEKLQMVLKLLVWATEQLAILFFELKYSERRAGERAGTRWKLFLC